MKERIQKYFSTLAALPSKVIITDEGSELIPMENAFRMAIGSMKLISQIGNKICFIGNGGSAAIASHMAIDYSKNGGMRSVAFNDGAAITCLANDFSFEEAFSKQIELHAQQGDIVVAVSSSGRSKNILNAVDTAKGKKCTVFTLSGFDPENPLRLKGDMNFYVPSREYGFVEITHLAILHAINDLSHKESK